MRVADIDHFRGNFRGEIIPDLCHAGNTATLASFADGIVEITKEIREHSNMHEDTVWEGVKKP